MRIVVDARISRGWTTGVGRYTTNLLAGFADRDEVECVAVLQARAPLPPIDGRKRPEFVRSEAAIGSIAQHVSLPLLLRRLRPDVVFVTHPLAASLFVPAPMVTAVLDLYPLHFPNQYPMGVAIYYRTVFQLIARRSAGLVAISQATKQDIVRRLGVPADRVAVTLLAADAAFQPVASGPALRCVLDKYGLSGPYLLYHGNKRPHKNVLGLLTAFALLERQRRDGVRLAITGREDATDREADFRPIRAEVARLGLERDIVFTDFVPDEDLPAVYAGALATVIPSFLEGFGLPAVESMACGTPVIASTAGSLPEVAGAAALLVDPHDMPALARALERIASDTALRDELARAGLERARGFTWAATVTSTLDVLRRAAAARTR